MNNNMNDDIQKLKNELSKANKIIEEQKIKIKDLEKQLNYFNNLFINNCESLQSFIKIINQIDNELNTFKTELNNSIYCSNNLKNNEIIHEDEIIFVNFISIDKKVHFSIPCIYNETFAEIEDSYINSFLNIEKLIINIWFMEKKF